MQSGVVPTAVARLVSHVLLVQGAAMAQVECDRVRKVFGKTVVIREITARMEDGSFVVLVGLSGCGKSTLLRMIAGLEEVTAGEIRIGNRVVNKVPPKERDIAMVFQTYALYPHMTVADNMAFALKLRRIPAAEIKARVGRAAEILGLTDFLGRRPRQLSGGQRQRVAMGRAIVRDPQVFLFDEPLSNLDAKLRMQMRTEIRELHARLGTTSVYVTHDQVEAMTMGQKIVVMREGAVAQAGSPLEIYDHLANLFVAGFIGSPAMNLVEGVVRGDGGAPAVVAEDGTVLAVPADTSARNGARVVYGIRPEHIDLEDAGGLEAVVKVVEPTGAEELVCCKAAGQDFRVMSRERHEFKTMAPASPRITPASPAAVMGSSRVRKCAVTTVNNGVVAFRIAASPPAIWVWPQTMRVNGMALLRTPMIARAIHTSRPRGSCQPSTSAAPCRHSAPIATLSATIVNGGNAVSALPRQRRTSRPTRPRGEAAFSIPRRPWCGEAPSFRSWPCCCLGGEGGNSWRNASRPMYLGFGPRGRTPLSPRS